MHSKIQSIISQLEQYKGIHVLYACESGSRAWGIPSSDSDNDVRFIYTHPADWYLSLSKRRDTISITRDGIDLVGWDLRKTFQLMKKSNAAALEWMNAPIIYHKSPGFLRQFREIGQSCCSPNALNFHYMSIAKKFYDACANEEFVKIKTWFYALRAVLNCRWVITHQQVPPMMLQDTLSLVNADLEKEILSLIAAKSAKEESFLIKKSASLTNFIEASIQLSETYKNKLPHNKVNMHAMDTFFKKMIHKKRSFPNQSKSYAA